MIGMSVEKMMHDMIEMLTDAMGDAVKHDKGNKAAGTPCQKGNAGELRLLLRPSVCKSKTTRTEYNIILSHGRISPLEIHA